MKILLMVLAFVAVSAQAELTPQQYAFKVRAVCESMANNSRFADPGATYGACIQGAKHSHAQCEKNMKGYQQEGEKMTGSLRAEWNEISIAYRIGCNQ